MMILRRAAENAVRQKGKTILNFCICMITGVLLNVYMGSIAGIEEELLQLPDAVPVSGHISSLNGSKAVGLRIKEAHIDGILHSEYIEAPMFSVQLKMGFGAVGTKEYREKLRYDGAGVTAAAAAPGLSQEAFAFAGVTDESGQEIDAETFFGSRERICVLDRELAKEQGIQAGERVTLTLAYYCYTPDYYGRGYEIRVEPLETEEYLVAGLADTGQYEGEAAKPMLLLPFESVRRAYREKGLEFFADAGSFRVRDPYQLNAFKQEMHDLTFMEVIPSAQSQDDGNALVVKDETFILAAEQLLRSRKLFWGMLPFVGLTVLCIGYVAASLLVRGRQEEYALMRSLGQSFRSCFGLLCLEYGITALAGCLLGNVISLLIRADLRVMLCVTGSFLLCYVLGEAAALLPLRRLSVLAVLGKND